MIRYTSIYKEINEPLSSKPIKLLGRIDTRQWDMDGDRWYPIPGSGDKNDCDFCGKEHEIHYHVTDGEKTYIVGGTCAKKLGVPNTELSKVDRRFKKIKEIEYYMTMYNLYHEIKDEIQKHLEIEPEKYDERPDGGFAIKDKKTNIGGIWCYPVSTASSEYKKSGITDERWNTLYHKVLNKLTDDKFFHVTGQTKHGWSAYTDPPKYKFRLSDKDYNEIVKEIEQGKYYKK